MKLTKRNSVIYIYRRVPLRYASVEDRTTVWISLHTDSDAVAQIKAPLVWAETIESWEAKLAGRSDDAAVRLAAAKELANRRGFQYLPIADVARLPSDDLLKRIEALLTAKGNIDRPIIEAVLGSRPAPPMNVSRALDEFWRVANERTLGKSADQIRRWRNPRIKAFGAFIEAVGDMPIADITTSHLNVFKTALLARVRAGKITTSSANKDLIHLAAAIKDVARSLDLELQFNTEKLMFKQGKANTRPPFSAQWITGKILATGALDGLNGEARAILLGMVNTGFRPSEGAMLTAAQIHLDAAIPHISIEPVGRSLKTDHAERIIPLAGVSLDAFRTFPNGFPRYADNPSLSDTINKFLRENGLLESEGHSLYSLRHSFEDRLLAAGVDERIRRDLMGHALNRERYGEGASLEHMLRIVQSIAL